METTDYGNRIVPLSLAGVATEFVIPTPDRRPLGITAGPDGNVWFMELQGNKIGRITPAGVIAEFSEPNVVGPFDALRS